MEILLTHAYYLFDDPVERAVMKPYPPLGLLYISSHLKRLGFGVEIFDTTFASKPDFRRYIERERPPVVGIYVNLMTRSRALEAVKICKAAGALVILGGPEPVNYADEYLARGADIIVAGEGELTLEQLIPLLGRDGLKDIASVPGIIYRDPDGQTARTEARGQIKTLDDQPLPDRRAIDIGRYMEVWRAHHGVSSISLITARGCPYKCAWCSHSVYGYGYRHRSPANVADEVEVIRSTYDPDQLWYSDDVFGLNKKWLFAYAEELKRRNLRIPFETISREDRLNEEVISTLADMGCRRLWIGAESGSQRILDAMDRQTNAGRMREMIGLLRKYGIESGTFIMLGYDGEQWRDLDATAAHLKASIPDSVLATVSYPIKGTPYYKRIADKITQPANWECTSDRDIEISGRQSNDFYRHAANWLISEVSVSRERRNVKLWRWVKAYLRARRSRLFMYLTRRRFAPGRE